MPKEQSGSNKSKSEQKKRERRAGEKNIPIIRVIAQSFAPSFESLAKWLRNSPACEQPCNFSLTCEILLFLTHASFHMLNKSLHACRLRLRTKANRCNHGHSTSRISEVIDTQHHVSLRYSKRSLCAVCRRIFPGTRSVRGGKMRRAAKSPKRPKIFSKIHQGQIGSRKTAFGRQTPQLDVRRQKKQ